MRFNVFICAVLAALPIAAAAAPFAYVPNEGSGTLSVIDIATDQVVAENRGSTSQEANRARTAL